MLTSLKVFVCSTFSDLSAEREAVLDAIRRLQLQHDSMEFFGARAEQPIETCLEEVRTSNVLVVIVGHRYGNIVPEIGISYSEAEYSEGYRLGRPCLVYIRDENVAILPRHMERDPENLKLLEKWKSTLQQRHTVATFQDGHKLAVQVAADLSRTIQDLEGTAAARNAASAHGTADLLTEVGQLVSDTLGRGVAAASLLSAIRRSISSLLIKQLRRTPTVCLSYARTDKNIVDRVADGLKKAGIIVWLEVASLEPGTQWMQEIERELALADIVAFFISPNSVRSGLAIQELQVALHRQVSGEGGAAILPILLEDAGVPPLLRQFHWLDMRDKDIDKGVKRLVEAIHYQSLQRG